MTTYIDLHVLQSVPPSNLNRDDTGSPKTATYGGRLRSRVSSQAWKRATRMAFNDTLDTSDIGYRTTRVVEIVAERIAGLDSDLDAGERTSLALEVVKATGLKPKAPRRAKGDDTPAVDRTEYLVFLSSHQADALAELALETGLATTDRNRRAKAVLKAGHSIDVALFGRMVADDATLNVDAAVQVAHALSTHGIRREYDYYTAVDDLNPAEETGAGMIGTIEFNSATLYRYATVNVDGLLANLGDVSATERAVRAFLDAFVRSMPTGKQNTFANGTLPDAVVAMVRRDRPVNLVGAFEEAVTPGDDGGYVRKSAEALAKHARSVAETFGVGAEVTYVASTPAAAVLAELGSSVTLPDLVAATTADAIAHVTAGESSDA